LSTTAERPLRGEARRGLLLAAALRVIAAEGPGAVTHRRVAAEAGLPLAATTYWFASKDELLLEAYRVAAERDLARVRELADACAATPPDRLAPALADLVASELADQRATLMASYALWLESARRPELREVERAWTDDYTAIVADMLAAAGAPDPRAAARLLIAGIDGLILAELSRDEPAGAAELRPLVGRLVSALVGGAA
jgi:DNA-binding transcriptional regulator YbjK